MLCWVVAASVGMGRLLRSGHSRLSVQGDIGAIDQAIPALDEDGLLLAETTNSRRSTVCLVSATG